MNDKTLRMAKSVLVAATLATIFRVSAGDLNPPAGPVGPTGRFGPRIEVNTTNTPGDGNFMFRITQPGSYYLGGNVTDVAGSPTRAIEITAGDVTLDLMGFTVAGGPGGLNGIEVSAAVSNIAILNGTIRGWGLDGIAASFATGAQLKDLRVSHNGAFGISVGAGALVTNCTASFNGSSGGFQIGISAGDKSVITGCSAISNTEDGIQAINGSTITGCTAGGNGSRGIVTDTATVTMCSTYSNSADGISAGPGATVRGCTSSRNRGDGITTTGDCLVAENTCDNNGDNGDGAGIHVLGADNRIERNNCTDNDRGIDVDSAGNFITRNTCEGNTTNWDVVVGNVCLVVNAATNAAPIVGNTGGVAPGSTDPNANFTY